MVNCKFCSEKLNAWKKKYCNTNCAQKWHYHNNPAQKERVLRNTRKSYEKNKNSIEYKQKRKNQWKKWINKNREKYNKQVLNYLIKKYYADKKQKLCVTCHKPNPRSPKIYCQKCADLHKTLQKKYDKKQKAPKGIK